MWNCGSQVHWTLSHLAASLLGSRPCRHDSRAPCQECFTLCQECFKWCQECFTWCQTHPVFGTTLITMVPEKRSVWHHWSQHQLISSILVEVGYNKGFCLPIARSRWVDRRANSCLELDINFQCDFLSLISVNKYRNEEEANVISKLDCPFFFRHKKGRRSKRGRWKLASFSCVFLGRPSP